jgi:hypothetical protein
MAKRQSEIDIPFTVSSANEDSWWAIVDFPIVLTQVKVDEYYLVIDAKSKVLTICKRDRGHAASRAASPSRPSR